MLGHLAAVSLKKSHDMVILSFCNVVKAPANREISLMQIPTMHGLFLLCSKHVHIMLINIILNYKKNYDVLSDSFVRELCK